MEIVYFIIVAAASYFVALRLLDWLEHRRGARFEYRQIYFFLILLGLAMGSFEIIGWLSKL